jgi:hypothetical protein
MVAMSHPDDVARLREIKRLLERIQRLPRLAGLPANGLADGTAGELTGGLASVRRHAEPANGRSAGRPGAHLGASAGPPHPIADLAPEPGCELAGVEPLDDDPLPLSFDPAHRDGELTDYWATDWAPDRSGDGARALVPVRAQPRGGFAFSPWVFIAATAVNTALAAALAIVITLGMARREAPPAETDRVAGAFKPAGEAKSEPVVRRPLALQPIGSANEPLRLEATKPARLPFGVRPQEALEESYTMRLTGLPANAALSGAINIGADSWHLPPGALANLEIVVPEWSAKVFEVGVELRYKNGELAAQSKLWLAVPPPPAPKRISLDEAALKELVRDGDKHFSRGDVVAARGVYERAAAMGSAQAALAMGTTFDQRRLWSHGVFGMVGDSERARHWYQRAEVLGHPEAKARISALQ